MKKIFVTMIALLLVGVPCYASVGILYNNTSQGSVTDINLETGVDYSMSGSVLTLGNSSSSLANPSIKGGFVNDTLLYNVTIGKATPGTAQFTTLNTSGVVNVNLGNFTVAPANGTFYTAGNAVIAGTENLTGALAVGGNVAVTGYSNFTKDVIIGVGVGNFSVNQTNGTAISGGTIVATQVNITGNFTQTNSSTGPFYLFLSNTSGIAKKCAVNNTQIFVCS